MSKFRLHFFFIYKNRLDPVVKSILMISDSDQFVMFQHVFVFYFFIDFVTSYIRSSEDISSGYSSTEPATMALSRTSSLTNGTTRYRPKAKKSEVIIVLPNTGFIAPFFLTSSFLLWRDNLFGAN